MKGSLLATLEAAGIEPLELQHLVELSLAEDLRYGPDITSEATISANQLATGEVVARERGIVSGVPVALAVLETVGIPLSGVDIARNDGDAVEPGGVVLRITGSLRQLLLAERTLLNFMTRLSGIATSTNAWVRALEPTDCQVRDTRKTTPGLRQLEKYAVRCGGGTNHRMGLGDAVLIKDNHIVATGGITSAVAAVRSANPEAEIEVECDTLDQVREAANIQCSLVLLDNMDLNDIKAAVAIARNSPGLRLEASGGMTLANAVAVARTGVDFIAVGALTHSVSALDLGLDLRT